MEIKQKTIPCWSLTQGVVGYGPRSSEVTQLWSLWVLTGDQNTNTACTWWHLLPRCHGSTTEKPLHKASSDNMQDFWQHCSTKAKSKKRFSLFIVWGFFCVPHHSALQASLFYWNPLQKQNNNNKKRTIQHIPFIHLKKQGRKAVGKVLAIKKGSCLKIYRTCLAT